MQSFMLLILICSVTMAVLSLFYMAITPLLAKRYSPKGRYYAWLIIFIALIIPFRPPFDNAIVRVDMPIAAAPIIHIGNGVPIPIETIAPIWALPSISLWQIAGVVWLVGMIVFLTYHVVRHIRFMKMVRRWSDKVTDKRTLFLYESIKSEMAISKNIELYLCRCVGSPTMIGIIRPCILLPNLDFGKSELRFILKHELIHYKRKDLYYKYLVLIATAVHWFNPIVYLSVKAINVLCEISCDTEVVYSTCMDTRQHYSETIIGVIKYQAKMQTALSTTFYGGKKGMKKRIFSIMDMSKKKAGVALVCCALLVTVGTGFVITVNAAGNAPMFPYENHVPTDGISKTDTIYFDDDTIYDFGTEYGGITGYITFNDERTVTYRFATESEYDKGIKEYLDLQISLGRITPDEADAILLQSQENKKVWSQQ